MSKFARVVGSESTANPRGQELAAGNPLPPHNRLHDSRESHAIAPTGERHERAAFVVREVGPSVSGSLAHQLAAHGGNPRNGDARRGGLVVAASGNKAEQKKRASHALTLSLAAVIALPACQVTTWVDDHTRNAGGYVAEALACPTGLIDCAPTCTF